MKIDYVKKFSATHALFVIPVFVIATLSLILPTQSLAQCDASFGDMGYAQGSFIDEGSVYQGSVYDGPASSGGFGGLVSSANCGPNGPCPGHCGGPYISIIGGYTGMQTQSVGNLELEYDDGFAVGAAIGRRLHRNIRVEAEYIYRENDFDSLEGSSLAVPFQAFGNLLSHSGMINGYFDMPIGAGAFVPYLGIGAGVTGIDSEVGQAGVGLGNSFITDGFDSSFAFQWMAGLSVRTLPNAELFVEYRFFEANDAQVELRTLASRGGIVDSEYVNDNVFFGVRMNF